MDWMQFVASLVKSLAWPSLVLFVVLVLRRPIGKALSSRPFKRLKAGPSGVEIEWEEKLDEVRAEVETELPAGPPREGLPAGAQGPSRDSEDARLDLLRIADVSPRAAVLESFSRLEALLRQEVPSGERAPSIRAIGRSAVDAGILSQAELPILTELSTLRNVAAHEALDIDRSRAVEYVDLVTRLIESIMRRRLH